MNYQWYPGHMTKAKRMMEENIKLIDIVIELVDARLPISSRNPDLEELAKGKSRLIVLNKTDMADSDMNDEWEKYFNTKGYYVVQADSRKKTGFTEVSNLINQACSEKIERDRRRGIINRPIRAMIVGIPNVGKSTFINTYAGKACAKTGNKPGVTKGKQWIRINKKVELLDTPGILWPKFDDQNVGMRLAMVGAIRDEILNIDELAYELIKYIHSIYNGMLHNRYKIEESEDALETLNKIAEVRGCVSKGAELDVSKAAAIIMEEFRNGKIGRITLEKPPV